MSRDLGALLALIGLAAVLRLRGLGTQSFWFDEAVTAHLIGGSLGDLFHTLPKSESTPPLYYVLAWLWRHVFGTSEAGLRSLSAVCGIAVVPVVWATGRLLRVPKAGLVAAALVAVNPALVWYSQEARAYELLALLGALSFLATIRALRTSSARNLSVWSILCVLALLTHYFAVFVVAPEATILLWKLSAVRRRAVVASLGPALAGLLLIPLAAQQEADGRTAWISHTGIGHRGGELLRELVTAWTSPVVVSTPSPHTAAWPLAIPAVLAGIAGLIGLRRGERRTAAALSATVGGGALVLPAALALTPLDYFYDRNLLAAVPILCIALAIGLTSPRIGRAWPMPVAALCLSGVFAYAAIAANPTDQRDDWRDLAAAVGSRSVPRAIVIRPAYASPALEAYGVPLSPAAPGTGVREVVVLGAGVAHTAAPARLGPFRVVETRRIQRLGLRRYRARGLVRLTARVLAVSGERILYEPSEAARAWFSLAVETVKAWQRDLVTRGPRDAHMVPTPTDQARLLAVPPEVANAAAIRRRVSLALGAAEDYESSPSGPTRLRLEEAIGALQHPARAGPVGPPSTVPGGG